MSGMYRRGLIVGGVVGAVLTAASAYLWAAPQPLAGAAGRTVTVDLVTVFNESQRQKDLAEEMKIKQDGLQKENQTRRDKIDQEQALLDKMNASDPTFATRARELLRMQIEYKNWFDLMQADLARETGVWTVRVYEEILAGIKDLAEKDGIELVLYRDEFVATTYNVEQVREQIRARKVLYAAGATDITQQVIQKLNEAYRAQPRQPMLQVGPVGGAPAPAPAPNKKP
ncbi:MAG: OmpH family outer membrane protein [Phycisphaerales bacterium]|nr:OmpH family outer membrane protein [Phycisphaerales bacterium]